MTDIIFWSSYGSLFRRSSYYVTLTVGRICPQLFDGTAYGQRCLATWEAIRKQSDDKIWLDSITEVAKKHQVMTGYWFITIPKKDTTNIDKTWRRVCHAVHKGLFGRYTVARVVVQYGDCDSRKVYKDDKKNPSPYLMSINTSDYTNVNEVMLTENVLRDIGVQHKLQYKPHIFKLLKIHADNALDNWPTLYKSTRNNDKRKSYIYNVHTRDQIFT